MSRLGDDELGLILSFICDHNDRKSFSQVSKHWLRVEGLTRSSIRLLEPHSLPTLITRFPNLRKFESSKPISDHHLLILAQTCPKLELINLNFRLKHGMPDYFDEPSCFEDVGDDGMCALAAGCHRLFQVSLRRRKNIANAGIVSLSNSAKHLRHLDLSWCNLITDDALEAIGAAKSVAVLNLQGCSLITDFGLAYLALGSPSKSLKKLVLAECDRITDSGVCLLQKISGLEELNIAECGPKVTDTGCLAISEIQTLRKLNLSWMVNVSDTTVIALAEHSKKLETVDFTGCELISGAGFRAFANHGSLEVIVLASCYNICADDVEYTVLRCKSLRYAVLDKGLRMWISMAALDNISRFCELRWR
ncbi:F-box/LRR-repeat protein 4-like [Senna tora]|uniref:F-box/LRR-repeat protein 4-like n=1 Tax=Senna tora TaxID=362788 RepID=A0A834T8A6_9FABA|nr:F-box/LRR-repeat protein 4-like [Senna tora]